MNNEGVVRSIEILLVEDSPGDVRLTREALKEAKMRNNLHVVGDGVRLCLFCEKRTSMPMRPALILFCLI